MSKTKITLPMKGIRTPRFFIWLRGFFHGKVIRTGGLEPETNIIASGYVTGQLKCFRNACVIRREEAEEKLAKVWCNADELLIDYAALTAELAKDDKKQNTPSESIVQARANEKAAKRRVAKEAECHTILKNLAKIANDVSAEYGSAKDQMEATAEILTSQFACYAHGLLMKPVYTHNLPDVHYEDCVKQIIVNHEDTWNTIISILKEGKE